MTSLKKPDEDKIIVINQSNILRLVKTVEFWKVMIFIIIVCLVVAITPMMETRMMGY